MVDFDANFEDVRDLTAAELSAAMGELLPLDKLVDEAYVGWNIFYHPEAVGVTNSLWSSHSSVVRDLIILDYSTRGLVFISEIALPSRIFLDAADVKTILEPFLNSMGMAYVEVFLGQSADNVGSIYCAPLDGECNIERMAFVAAVLHDYLLVGRIAASPEEMYSSVLSGTPHLLLGRAESDLFDAKRTHYPKGDERKRLELAVDVAAFANTARGGLLLIGIQTVRDSHNRDVVADVDGCEIDHGAEARYRSAIDSLVFPGVAGLAMCRVSARRGEIFAILVPPQSGDRQPFVVRGGTSSVGRISSAMFQVPIRQGDANASLRIEEIHKRLRSWGDG
ncbi:AlbA family DNA-binding domain-containing protein [Nocardia araoensis]|uniref:AlbA family DNA-binding domain-containing protein n=1 Tax=Nocardia araoensis TaxID=228600 RepID=UPI0012F69690|nr:hypothetical protein [Nocardia araoensis]